MIKYFVDGEVRYLIGGKSYTEGELQALREETARKDEQAGYNDRRVGVYDKWYRYNRTDDGAAYDRGQQRAVGDMRYGVTEVSVIECAH